MLMYIFDNEYTIFWEKKNPLVKVIYGCLEQILAEMFPSIQQILTLEESVQALYPILGMKLAIRIIEFLIYWLVFSHKLFLKNLITKFSR